MKTKINCVMLVDDDDATNFIHSNILKQAGFTGQIKIVENGLEALNFIKSDDNTDYIKPDIIFLDINMPVMNGWEFLSQYKELDEQIQSRTKVVMLTTSYNPDDRTNSERDTSVDYFMNKHLTVSTLHDLQDRFFAKGA